MWILAQKQINVCGHEGWKVKPARQLQVAVRGHLWVAVGSRKVIPGRAQFCVSWGRCHLLWKWEVWKNPFAEILPKQFSRMAVVSIESVSADKEL